MNKTRKIPWKKIFRIGQKLKVTKKKVRKWQEIHEWLIQSWWLTFARESSVKTIGRRENRVKYPLNYLRIPRESSNLNQQSIKLLITRLKILERKLFPSLLPKFFPLPFSCDQFEVIFNEISRFERSNCGKQIPRFNGWKFIFFN